MQVNDTQKGRQPSGANGFFSLISEAVINYINRTPQFLFADYNLVLGGLILNLNLSAFKIYLYFQFQFVCFSVKPSGFSSPH